VGDKFGRSRSCLVILAKNLSIVAKNLKVIRDNLNLNQAQMAGLLGLNRRHLAELESGRKSVPDWVIKKAQEVERRMAGINLTAPRAGRVKEAEGLAEFTEEVAALTTDELGEIAEHLTESLRVAPRVALFFYESALKIVHAEVRRRLNSFNRKSLKVKK
jgi:DNA-binding XRE family transcriptional regulator